MSNKWNQFPEENNKGWKKVPGKPEDFSIFLIGAIILKLTANIFPVAKKHPQTPASQNTALSVRSVKVKGLSLPLGECSSSPKVSP